MDFEFFVPCQPNWLCKPFFFVFTLLLLVGLGFFIRIVYREYLKSVRVKNTHHRRRMHYRDRKGGDDGRPTNLRKH
ncbi:hypothetical protein ACFODT_12385 [Vibrio zhugei]|uniref:Uncharacterized protein n=1 Tax=Vibrio zhugei TaxID=2479546 RepID=A0ABV7CCW9_9VIBR|nr:hypothetical protein [Vibrio zhugei]